MEGLITMEKITTEQQFKDAINNNIPVVVKFKTTWCPDCKRLDMFIGDIIEEFKELQWYEIDKDEFPGISEQNQVRGIPSLLVYKNGEKLAHLHSANAKTPEQVREFLEAL